MPNNPSGWLLVTVFASAASAVLALDAQWGAFAAAAVLAIFAAARWPAFALGALLALGPSDLWLTVDAGGFTFRLAHVLAVALWAAAAARVGVLGLLRWTLGAPGMWLWLALLALQAVSIARGVAFPGKAVGYLAWGAFDVLVLAPAVAFHARRHPLRLSAAWWPLAAAVGVFGLLQLALAAVGTAPMLVQQWVGARPRINALSYEPSYFAFQALVPLALMVGWWSRGLPRALALLASGVGLVLAVAVALSSSRSGWIGLALLALAGAWPLFRRHRGAWSGPVGRVLAAGAAVVVLGVVWMPPHVWAADKLLMQKGLDFSDPSSSQPRREGVLEAINLARLYPLAGVGPGQFGAALLAHPQAQVRVLRPEDRDPHGLVTFNLYAELLSENGILGLLLALGALLQTAWRLWRAPGGARVVAWRTGVLWASLLMFAVMFQFNQTLWRVETWCLLGLAMTARRRP